MWKSLLCLAAVTIMSVAQSFAFGMNPAFVGMSGLSVRSIHSRAPPLRHGSTVGDRAILGGRLKVSQASGLRGARCSEDWRAEERVVIVGAGVAGMSCAIQLAEKGIPVTIVEADDGVGGRVRTDKVDGYLLDRGFQIFLTSYPEAQRLLDYKQLKLKPFYAGANVRWSGGFHKVADPFRQPIDAVLTLLPTHPIGSIFDKILVGVLRLQSLIGDLDSLWLRPDIQIEERLSYDIFFGSAFSKEMVDRFFRPFLGGIFFDNKLRTTARELEFVFRMLALGENCLPEVRSLSMNGTFRFWPFLRTRSIRNSEHRHWRAEITNMNVCRLSVTRYERT